jgi:glycosyltransferase involved in cell wall biosynthesis
LGRPLRIGLHSPYFGSTYGGGEKYLAVTAEAIRDGFPGHLVEIVSPVPADRTRYEQVLGVDLAGIKLAAANPEGGGLRGRLSQVPALRPYRNLAVAVQAARRSRAYDLYLAMVYVVPAHSRARTGLVLCQFPYQLGGPHPAAEAPARLLRKLLLKDELDGFKQVVCQSEYVREWTRRYWNRESLVINPPVDVPEQEPAWNRKRNLLLSVGRFVAGGHNKRHDVLIRTFRKLVDGGLGGWELHLAGSRHHDPDSRRQYEQLEELAQGAPVHLQPDISREGLQRLYQEASIYWHAAGFGVDPEVRPGDLEHFGMTTAEAMSHGAVPVAIGLGGQPEVLRDGVDGYLWEELYQLEEHTLRLARDPGLRRQLGASARDRSRRFSRSEFKRRMVEALAPVIRELEDESA